MATTEKYSVKVSVSVTPEQAKQLDELHRRTRVPKSVLVREALELLVAKRGAQP